MSDPGPPPEPTGWGRLELCSDLIAQAAEEYPELWLIITTAANEIADERERTGPRLSECTIALAPPQTDQESQTDPVPGLKPLKFILPPTNPAFEPEPRNPFLEPEKTIVSPSESHPTVSSEIPPLMQVPVVPPTISPLPATSRAAEPRLPMPLLEQLDLTDASRIGCWNCDSPNHDHPNCPHPQLRLFCKRCGWRGCKVSNCPKCAPSWRVDPSRASRQSTARPTPPPHTRESRQRAQRESPPRYRHRDMDPSPRRFDFVRRRPYDK